MGSDDMTVSLDQQIRHGGFPMKRLKLLAVPVFVMAALLFSGSGVAFAQRHNTRHPAAAAPPPAAPVVANPNMDCTIVIPAHPLTAVGLATPYQLKATDPNHGPCDEANANQSAFVQAAILDPATGQISTYAPLVVNQGTTPAVDPVVPTLPANAIVALWFGYNGNNLTQQSALRPEDLRDSNCVNGDADENSLFSQFSYCNAPAFFTAANQAIKNGQLVIPPLGTGNDQQTCPTVRSFAVVDQDQSDNLPVSYLLTRNGQLAQNTANNLATFFSPGATPTKLGNPSDNRLVDIALDGALGCTPWKVPDLADPGQMSPALPLNELQAAALQATPVALIPAGDPMVLVNGNADLDKINLYRSGVNQPAANSYFDADTARYCRQMLRVAPAKMLLDMTKFMGRTSPVPAAAIDLFTFMAQRFVASYQILNCASLIHQDVPITLTVDGNGVTTLAAINMMLYADELNALKFQQAADDAADKGATATSGSNLPAVLPRFRRER
jgi:hypothetical protein